MAPGARLGPPQNCGGSSAFHQQACALVAAGESHSMSLTSDRGQLYTWGLGDYGKLGHGRKKDGNAHQSAKEKARRRSEKTRRRALRRIQARRTGVAAPSLSPSSSGGSSTEPPPPSGLQLPDAVFARQ